MLKILGRSIYMLLYGYADVCNWMLWRGLEHRFVERRALQPLLFVAPVVVAALCITCAVIGVSLHPILGWACIASVLVLIVIALAVTYANERDSQSR